MTHDELLKIIHNRTESGGSMVAWFALRAIVELHKPDGDIGYVICDGCDCSYPCLTIQTIQGQLSTEIPTPPAE